MEFAILFAAAALALAPAQAGSAEPWTASDVIQPAALAQLLRDGKAQKPAIVYVGPSVLYRSKHIPGAVFAGPASTAKGMALLHEAMANVPRAAEVVIYCGCCPWEQCPNIRPAFTALAGMGYKRAKVLALPTSFYKDWIEKGYPVETGLP
jgi:3-mercaptopyruvate sulfurtransferase SseA